MTWFGAGLIVQPKLIDVEKEILKIKDLVDYPALLATVCVIGGLYIIAMIWARRQDNNDILKVKTLCMHALCFSRNMLENTIKRRFEVAFCLVQEKKNSHSFRW